MPPAYTPSEATIEGGRPKERFVNASSAWSQIRVDPSKVSVPAPKIAQKRPALEPDTFGLHKG